MRMAWVNDDKTLRAYGSKTDAYATFKGMLEDGNPPDNFDALLKEAAAAGKRATKSVERLVSDSSYMLYSF